MYHEAIETLIKRNAKEIEIAKKTQDQLLELDKMIKEQNLQYARSWICNGHAAVYLYPNHINDMKPIIKYLGERKYFIENFADEPDNKTMCWDFVNKQTKKMIYIFAKFGVNGASCKYVKTGTITKPLYKLVCE